jgi:hydroxyacylglutathione hydrolase
MKQINQSGPASLANLRPPARLPADTLAKTLGSGHTVIDTRESPEFTRGAVPGSINIPANRSFTTWAGSLLPYDRELYLIVDDHGSRKIGELVRDLTGIALERIAGYYGPEAIDHWRAASGSLQSIPSLGLKDLLAGQPRNGGMILDVRGEGEWKAGHIPGSLNVPLAELDQRLSEVGRSRPLIVHCQTGSRAAIAASLLRARGVREVFLFPGGFAEWRESGQTVAT